MRYEFNWKNVCLIIIFALLVLVFLGAILGVYFISYRFSFFYPDPLFNFFTKPAQASVNVTATVELTVQPACSDDIDNDSDGLIDYPADPGCSSANDTNEYNAPSDGGGGGGGGGASPPPTIQTTVVFTGRAYPKSAVTLLKDAQVSATTIAGADANFQITLSGLSAGNYIFSLYGEDKDGRRSVLLTFPVSVTAGATTNVSGIFIAPTIAVDKIEVKKGDNIAILGQSASQADIIISVNSEEEFFAKTISDKDGAYFYNFDTSILDLGSHNTKSKAAIGNQLVSSWSYLVNFKVGAKTVLAKPLAKAPSKGNLNGDGDVNLIDLSILLYNWGTQPKNTAADLNSDGRVDLRDFSIMLYYWTG